MSKKEFYKIQAEQFRSYASKFEIENLDGLLFLFNAWAESKDFDESDKKGIWRFVKIKLRDAR